MSRPYCYVIIDHAGERFFLNAQGTLTCNFDAIMRFSNKSSAEDYLRSHPQKVGRTEIVSIR